MLWSPSPVSPTDRDQPLQDETQIKVKFYFCGQRHRHISKPRWSRWPERWSQTGFSLSVEQRGIQLAKKQKGRATKSLRDFLAWCFPYANPKMAATGPHYSFTHSYLSKNSSHIRWAKLCLLHRWLNNLLIMLHPNTSEKISFKPLNYALDGY